MSSGQIPRHPDYFPDMKYRAHRRRPRITREQLDRAVLGLAFLIESDPEWWQATVEVLKTTLTAVSE